MAPRFFSPAKRAANQRQMAEQRGRRAETLAALYLRCKGYKCLGKRVKTSRGEIDLVLRRKRQIVFAEVKLRQTIDAAAHAIPPRVQGRIIAAAKLWLAQNPKYADHDMRFDAILMAPGKWPQHLEDAFALPT